KLTCGRVGGAGCVKPECLFASGCVRDTLGVAKECLKSSGSIANATRVAGEGFLSSRRVLAAGCVASERMRTDCRVAIAGVCHERVITQKRAEGADVAAFLANRSRSRRKRKACEDE